VVTVQEENVNSSELSYTIMHCTQCLLCPVFNVYRQMFCIFWSNWLSLYQMFLIIVIVSRAHTERMNCT